jgi:hypothetical protein
MSRIFQTTWALTLILFTLACQKQHIKGDEEIIGNESLQKSNNSGGCRITMYDYYNAIDDYHTIDYLTYKNGLVDEWTAYYGSVYKMEYGAGNKLMVARVYDGGSLTYTIKFIYQNNKIVKELWYEGATQVLVDEVTITRNAKGEIIKTQSPAFNNIVLYTHDSKGNVTSWSYFEGGIILQKGDYTYDSNTKDPYLSASGIDYAFPYANSGFVFMPNWYSSEKITLYDQNGVPTVYYDLDPTKTVWTLGRQNYPLQATYYNQFNTLTTTNTFSYENCGPGGHAKTAPLLRQKLDLGSGKKHLINGGAFRNKQKAKNANQ